MAKDKFLPSDIMQQKTNYVKIQQLTKLIIKPLEYTGTKQQ